jgi:hypothetical protein
MAIPGYALRMSARTRLWRFLELHHASAVTHQMMENPSGLLTSEEPAARPWEVPEVRMGQPACL